MSAHGRLTLTHGGVSASVPNGPWIEAAITDTIAGVELAIKNAIVSIGTPEHQRRADVMLTLDMHPATMTQLVLELARALKLPAFTDSQWLQIADACQQADLDDIAAHITRARPDGGS